MAKIAINILNYSHDVETIRECMDSILAQSFEDLELVYMDNESKYRETCIPFVQEAYGNNPRVKIVIHPKNLGYTGGHNDFFTKNQAEFLMVINPDTKMEKDFLAKIMPIFDDPKVAAATGKIIKPFKNENGETILDSTGVSISRSRAAYDRGHLEVDKGQYDSDTDIFGVSGAGAIYRKTALEDTKLSEGEYFDKDYFAYMEDVDLSWRMRLYGYSIRFVPAAILFHERALAASEGGLKSFLTFLRHNKSASGWLKGMSLRNRLWTLIKCDFGFAFWKDSPFIIVRELAKWGYVVVLKRDTFWAIPEFFKGIGKMRKKRALIQSRKVVSSAEMAKWFK
jgi:GT2 family glycosyltransferase